LIEQQDGKRAWRDVEGDLLKMHVHSASPLHRGNRPKSADV
jgi:hypothetical protein